MTALDKSGTRNYYHAMSKQRDTMTNLLRQSLLDCDSLSAVERVTGLKRQALARFMRGEQSLRLDLADKLAEHFGIEHVLASALVEDAQGNFTGEPVRPLPYGPGKVLVARAWALAHDVDLEASAFFTDSVSDLPLLEAVAEPVAVNPDPRLWWAATRRGWRVVYW